MNSNSISYTTVDQQISKLESQNLIIENRDYAAECLLLYGYSNLIKSYREPYMITEGDKKVFRSGVTFGQICSLYILDKALRNSVMASMLDLEEHIKEAAADTIAKSFGVHQDDYLKFSNYRNKRKRKRQFTLPGILDTMKDTINTSKNPIYHYRTAHNVVPPWILFKSIYFSTIVNFIDLFKTSEKTEVAHRIYDNSKLRLSNQELCQLMMDTLYLCLDYRNIAAHGGRTYNYISPNRIRIQQINERSIQNNVPGFSQLLFLLDLIRYAAPILRLKETLTSELNRHCSRFPQDITYLGQVLNINIITRDIVYVSEKSHKYHRNPHCSGIQNVAEIPIEDAMSKGYLPCKRCCKEIQVS